MKLKVSAKKIAANKANAQKSKGPKTQLGKSKTKHNAVKHSAYATSDLLMGEDKELFEELKSEQCGIFKPKTFIERALVGQLINELWTLRRVAKAENMHLVATQDEIGKHGQLTLTPSANELMKRATEVDEENATQADVKILEQLNKKVTRTRLDATYKDVFVFDSGGDMQKLTLMKRHILQSILSIERELERRMNERKNKNSAADWE